MTVDVSKTRKRQLAFELQSSRVFEKRSKQILSINSSRKCMMVSVENLYVDTEALRDNENHGSEVKGVNLKGQVKTDVHISTVLYFDL